MTTVNIQVPLLREDNSIGSISFSYDDQISVSVILPGRRIERDIFFLERFILQIEPGEIGEIADLSDGFEADFSNQLVNSRLAYSPLPRSRNRSFIATRQVGGNFINVWTIETTTTTTFLTDGSSWGIAPSNTSSMQEAEVSGDVGEVEIISESQMPIILSFPGLQIPTQVAPISRRTTFDPNFNADPAIAIACDPNDPKKFVQPLFCGCSILSGTSMAMCLAMCRLL